MNAASSRAMAVTTMLAFLPRAIIFWNRLHSRTCARQAMSRTASGNFLASPELPRDACRETYAQVPNQCTMGVNFTSLGDTSEPPFLSGGVFAGMQPEKRHQLAGFFKTRQVAEFSDGHNSDDETYAAQQLKCFEHRGESPGFHVLCQFELQPLDSLEALDHGASIFLEDDLLSGGCALDLAEPAQVWGFPVGLAIETDVVTQQE